MSWQVITMIFQGKLLLTRMPHSMPWNTLSANHTDKLQNCLIRLHSLIWTPIQRAIFIHVGCTSVPCSRIKVAWSKQWHERGCIDLQSSFLTVHRCGNIAQIRTQTAFQFLHRSLKDVQSGVRLRSVHHSPIIDLNRLPAWNRGASDVGEDSPSHWCMDRSARRNKA